MASRYMVHLASKVDAEVLEAAQCGGPAHHQLLGPGRGPGGLGGSGLEGAHLWHGAGRQEHGVVELLELGLDAHLWPRGQQARRKGSQR